MAARMRVALGCAFALALFALATSAQGQGNPARWEFAGVPAVNYDSDEGFGYGVIAELYRHGDGLRPYRYTVQPALQFSTRGRRDLTVFFDAPHLLPGGLRADAFVGSEEHIATPYYGLGNLSNYDPTLDREGGPSPYFYRFGRTRRQALLNVQRGVGFLPVRLLLGAGVSDVTIDTTPYDDGSTLLHEQLEGSPAPGGLSNHVRAGLIWDSRDRETGPTRGAWSEVLVQRFDRNLGSDFDYTRWTATDRRYLSLGTDRVVFANRFLLQGVEGDAPFYDLFTVQTSFKQQEGLGGAKTVRGLAKNRYLGKGLFLWNAELRVRAADFSVAGRAMHLVVSGFGDTGRVWEDSVDLAALGTNLHHGFGGGVRLGMTESFVVAVDAGRSGGATALYIGLGYLY